MWWEYYIIPIFSNLKKKKKIRETRLLVVVNNNNRTRKFRISRIKLKSRRDNFWRWRSRFKTSTRCLLRSTIIYLLEFNLIPSIIKTNSINLREILASKCFIDDQTFEHQCISEHAIPNANARDKIHAFSNFYRKNVHTYIYILH